MDLKYLLTLQQEKFNKENELGKLKSLNINGSNQNAQT